jgi:hypothetical protein
LGTAPPAELKPEAPAEALGVYDEQPAPEFAAYATEPAKAKGIYVTASIAGIPSYFETRLDLANTTEINAMVIDIKTDEGDVAALRKIPLADEMGVSRAYINDFDAFMDGLKAAGIYTIARVVVFKDNRLYETRPEFAIQMRKDGYEGVYRAYDRGDKGPVWLNPYNRELWDYYVELSKQIANLGFDEIQYDYIRFPTDRNVEYADYGETGGLSKIDIINEFSRYICDGLKNYPVRLSADIFATVIDSALDASLIGQDPIALAQIFDIICPMVYPSHYAPGSLGLAEPDLEPYETVFRSMSKLRERCAAEIPGGGKTALIRPWLQDFSFSGKGHMQYGSKEVRDEIQAAYDAGLDEWLLWNAANKYTRDALLAE